MTGYFSPRTRVFTEAARSPLRMGRIAPCLVSASALIWATQAFADTTISNGTTTPVKTSTANGGAPDNVVVAAGGEIKPASGVAITLDSNNTVSNSGVIQFQDVNGVAGIQAIGGHTGSITNAGTITVNETTQQKDTDGDGDLDGPFATGSNRFGIQVIGPGAFTGPISNTGSITVQGNDSAAISVETPLAGSLSNTGSITVLGDRTYGIHTLAGVTGNVSVMGTVSATGLNAQGVALGSDVNGAVVVQGTVTTTGYRYTTRPTDTYAPYLSKLDADDLLQGGPAVSIAGNVTGGFLVDVPPTIDANNPDVDGDGIPDASETSGAIISYGAAPAVQIGAVGHDITLGNVGAGDSAYGVVIKGTLTGSGVYDGVGATGLQLGVAGGGAVNTSGGVRVIGSITAQGYGAVNGVLLNGGAVAPALVNSGSISATSTTNAALQSRAVAIEAGATLPTITNSGSILASMIGTTGNAGAIVDNSGTLSRIENTGTIKATVTASANGGVPGGVAVAVDDRANASGLYLWQHQTSGSTTTPATTGEVLLGAGADRLDILAGTLSGDIAFGAGANALNIDGGGAVAGAVTADSGTLALNIGTGSLQINNAAHLNLTSLNLGAGSKLTVTVDPAAGASTLLDVSGAATIASGAKIGVRLDSILQGPATYTVIRAGQLTAGSIDSSALSDAPYLYTESLTADQTAGTVAVNVAPKTAAEIGLPQQTAGAFAPLLTAANTNTYLRQALLNQTDRAGFVRAYNQLLPEHSGSIFQTAEAATQAFAAPLDDREAGSGGGAWAQEINYGAVQDSQGDLPGYKAWGVGLVGGYETPVGPVGLVGVTLGLSSSSSRADDTDKSGKLQSNMVQLGGYWRMSAGGFSANAHVAGDYLKMTSDRTVSIYDDSGDQLYNGTATGHWSGTGINGRVRVAYESHFGDFYAKPQAGFDYLRLAEHGYTEHGDDALDLAVSGRTSSRLSGFAGLALGAAFGNADGTWGPELLVGYRNVVSDNLADTQARFTAGGDSFRLAADDVGGQGGVVRLGLKGENGFGGFAVEAGAERRDDLTIYDLRVAAHFQF